MKVKIHHFDDTVELFDVDADIIGRNLDELLDNYVEETFDTFIGCTYPSYWYEVFHEGVWMSENKRENLLKMNNDMVIKTDIIKQEEYSTGKSMNVIIEKIVDAINENRVTQTVNRISVFKMLKYLQQIMEWNRDDFYEYVGQCQEKLEAEMVDLTNTPETQAYIKFFNRYMKGNTLKADFFKNRTPF